MKTDVFLVREFDRRWPICHIYLKRKKAGFHFPLHWHNYIEFEILLSGHGTHVCNGREYEISAGDVWLMSFCDFHAVTLDTDSLIMQIGFNRGFLLPELEAQVATCGLCSRFDEKTMEEVRELCFLLDREGRERGAFYETARKAIVNRLAVLLLRSANGVENVSPSPEIGKVLAYVHENFRENLSMETLAEMHGFSPNYFGNLFKSSVGMSFRDYLNKIRLKYACDLLSSSTLGTKEIAFASGYRSVEYFLYVFKKNLSITPSAYRDATKK